MCCATRLLSMSQARLAETAGRKHQFAPSTSQLGYHSNGLHIAFQETSEKEITRQGDASNQRFKFIIQATSILIQFTFRLIAFKVDRNRFDSVAGGEGHFSWLHRRMERECDSAATV